MKRIYITILSLILLIAGSVRVNAQDYLMYEATLEGTAFHTDSATLVYDSLIYMYAGTAIDSDYLVKDVISLVIKDNESVVFPDSFSCAVKVAIEEYDINNNEITTYKILHVSYNTRNLALDTLRSFYQFYNKYRVKDSIISITINGISGSTPDIFMLTNTIEIERQYNVEFCGLNWFNGVIDTAYLPAQDELFVSWETLPVNIPGFSYDEFDLEWTFYDDSSVLIKDYTYNHESPYKDSAFNNNATRIQTANNWYQIPLLYEEGYVMYRIRTVQILPSGQRLNGPWTSTTASGNNLYIYHIGGQADSLNWQAKTSYAEEGKRKSVVSYFDGASKNRQSVTKINTDTMSIAAETIYDYEGRPVVNTLPSPTFQQLIKHFDNFNQDMSGNPYSWQDADSSNDCSNTPGVMNTVSGSSHYYSPANPLKSISYNQYIPNAWGYPFSQQVYTADLTGRIKFSSGPGLYHHMGTQHITQYLYGAPAQQELTELFGTEIGVASHYFKNATIDPNGQTTVTYTDMHGRTIATALSGIPLYASLDTLSEFRMDTILDVIIDTNSNIINGDSIICTKTFMSLVAPVDTYFFKYCLLPLSDTVQLCNGSEFCFDCIYDITIRITDDCNNFKLPGDTPVLRVLHDYSPSQSLNNFDTLCSNLPPLVVDSFYLPLPPGTYTVTKTLTINSNAINYYYNYFLTRDTCIKNFNDFYVAALNQVDLSGCNMTCQTCEQQLGDSATFVAKYLAAIVAQDSLAHLQAQDTLNAASAFSELKSYCNMLCDSFTICDQKRIMMLNDMSPGGQYALDTPNYQATDPASIFYSGPPVSASAYVNGSHDTLLFLPVYSNPRIVYLNEQGVPDTLLVDTTNGSANDPGGSGNLVSVLPNQLSIQNFEKYWKSSWANALLPYHPEYCFYQFCIANSASNDYDSWEASISNYDTAKYYGLLNPLDDQTLACPFPIPIDSDPFFAGTGYGYAFYSNVKAQMDVYESWGSPDSMLSIWQIVSEMASGGGSYGSTSCPNCMKSYYWMDFRNIYQGIKQKWVDSAMSIYVHNTGNCNKIYPDFNSAPLAGKQPRYGRIADSLWSNSSISNPSTLLDSTQTVYSADSTASFSCTSYAPYWWGQLNQCGIPQADSALIINELIAVCTLGTDSVHMFGSTTTPGSGTTTANGNWTFEQVLNWATTATTAGGGLVPWTYHSSDTCSSWLITNPMPYGTQILYYESDAIQTPDSCTCHKIMSFYSSYAATDSATMNFATYLDTYYNMVIDSDDAYTLVQACTGSACLLMPHPVEVPYQFSCTDHCATCAEIDSAYTAFLNAFPGVTASVNYLTLMQSWMNSHLDFNITAQEYLNFLNDSCGNNYYTVDTSSPPSRNCPVPSNSNSSTNVIAGCTSVINVVSGTCTGNCNAGIISVNTGTASTSDGQITYTAQGAAGSYDTVVYRVCNQCGICDTADIFISIISGTCIIPSSAINHNYYICSGDVQTFLPLQGNTPPANSQFSLTGFIPASPAGVIQNYNDFTFQAPDTAVADTFRYIICATGSSTVCDTAYIFIQANNCNIDSGSVPTIRVASRRTSNSRRITASKGISVKNKSAFEEKAIADLKLPLYQMNGSSTVFNTHKNFVPQGINYALILKHRFGLTHSSSLTPQTNKPVWQTHTFFGERALASSQGGLTSTNKTYARKMLSESLAGWEKQHPFNVQDSIMHLLNNKANLKTHTEVSNHKGLAYYFTHHNGRKSIAYSMFHTPPMEPASAKAKATAALKSLMANGLRANALKSAAVGSQNKYNANRQKGIQALLSATDLRNAAMNKISQSRLRFIESLKEKQTLVLNKGISTNLAMQKIPVGDIPIKSLQGQLAVMPLPGTTAPDHPQRKLDGSFSNWCDSLTYMVNQYDSIYVATGNSNYSNLLNFLFDSLGISADIVYWQGQFANCGINCPPIVSCSIVSGLMSTFASTYPIYSSQCPAYIWAYYLNANGGGNFGGANNWFYPSQWMAILNCCGISYPGQDTLHNMCDSINAILPLCTPGQPGTMACLQGELDNTIGYNYDSQTGLFGDITYWLNQFNTCGISCSGILPCGTYDSLMSVFKSSNPLLADSCPAFIWVNYMNRNSGYSYAQNDWTAMLNCCGITYPVPDTFPNRCDSVTAIVNEFNGQAANGGSHSLYDFESTMAKVFGAGYYIDSNATYYSYTDSFWFALVDTCHAGCPAIVNCSHADSLLGVIAVAYPADSLPDFVWATYLNTNNAGANGSYGTPWYSPQQWRYILSCCGMPLPSTDTAYTICDSLRDVTTYFNYEATQGQSHNMWDFEGYVGTFISWNYDITYWYGLINSCHLACPNIISCQYTDSLLNAFISQNPEFDTIPDFIWTGYLNYYGAGVNTNYTTQQWRILLQCCSPPTLIPDSVTTTCDSLQDVVKYFNYQAGQDPNDNQNIWAFEQDAGRFIAFGYTDSLGNWHPYDYGHWAALMDSCHISCPNLINCHIADSLLTVFLTQTPGVADSCPAFVWANYLNEADFTNGNWYSTDQWIGLLTCCGIHYPRPDTFHTTCDTVNFIVNTNIDTVPMPLVGIVSNLDQLFNNGNNSTLGYWLSMLSSCGYSCGQFSNCHLLDSVLTGFIAQYPQYADSCPATLLASYLNTQFFPNSGVQGSYSDYDTLYTCCHITLPRGDSTLNHCDTAAEANLTIQYYDEFLASIIGDTICKPVWLWEYLISQDSFLLQCGGGTISGLSTLLGSCGYPAPDTCVFHSTCDSLDNFYQVILVIYNANATSGGNGGASFSTVLTQEYDQIYNSSDNYAQIMMQMLPCGNTTLCDTLNNEVMPIVAPILATYDSLCIEPSVLAALFDIVSSDVLTYPQWLYILQNCGETLPPICHDSLSTMCDTIMAADTLVTRIVALYGVDPTQFMPVIMSLMLGYQVSTYTTTDSLISACGGSGCSSVVTAYDQLGATLHFDTCYPAWYISALWNMTYTSEPPLPYSCSLLTACNLPCPDTCGGIGTTTCDTIITIYTLYRQMAQTSGIDTLAVVNYLMNSLLNRTYSSDTVAYDSLISMYNECVLPNCYEVSAFMTDYDSLFLRYPDGIPAEILADWANTFFYEASGNPSDLTAAQVEAYITSCTDYHITVDTTRYINSCDSILGAYHFYQNYIAQFPHTGYAPDTLLGYIFNVCMGCYPDLCYTNIGQIDSLISHCINPDTLTCANVSYLWDLMQSQMDTISGIGTVTQATVDSLMLADFNNYLGCYALNCYSLQQIAGLMYKCVGPTCNPTVDSATAAVINQLINNFTTANPSLMAGTQAALDTALYAYLDSVCHVSVVNWCNMYTKCSAPIVCPTVNANPNSGKQLCNRPLFPPIQAFTDDSCMATMQQYALQNASMEYQDYIQALYDSFVNQYITKCLGVWRNEHMYDRHRDGEYHYTLYYYDQAGNLVQTVPPDGAIPGVFPHTYLTKYRYNTQNQVVEQLTPDGDSSYFWYDRIFKLTFSQNSKQLALNQRSYTLYDAIQRIIEVGRYDGLTVAPYSFWDEVALTDTNWYSECALLGYYPREVTHTYYDYDYLGVAPHFQSIGMTNLRNRVASVIYADTLTTDSSRYDAATHYSYDVDGNVQTLLQENRHLKKIHEDWKRIDYRYDLISGKVNNVSYQSGQPDAMYHYYEYDADNRITDVYTSRDSTFFDHDAYYEYYLHGPLARAVIGDRQVQAVNYAYTIQGWLKAINGDRGYESAMMGLDGVQFTPNWLVGYDVYGFSLGYFTGDYSNINGANPVASDFGLNSWDLYNGNISRTKGFNWALHSLFPTIPVDTGMAYRYRYDQLNRLTGMNASLYLCNTSDTSVVYTSMPDYGEHVKYDPNGNIQTYFRNGTTANGQPLAMDSLSYKYQNGNNRLDHVNDAVPASNYSVDIDNEDTLNYQYDQIGNLTKDSSGGIDSIYWTIYGKIWKIVKYNGDTIKFAYDPSGNRIMKEVFKDSLHKWIGTYYVHDATGNIMSTYHWYNKDTFDLDELVMYGSSRLGTIGANQYLTDTITRDSLWYALHPIFTNPLCDSINYDATGLKQYEFTNHLGNVLVTLTDKHIPFYFGSFTYYYPEVASAQDYYPFGMIMPGRNYRDSVFRFGFSNQEKDDEIEGVGNTLSFKYRIFSSLLGRFFSPDPLTKKFPWNSSYAFAENKLGLGKEFEGLELISPIFGVNYEPIIEVATKADIVENVGKIGVDVNKVGGDVEEGVTETQTGKGSGFSRETLENFKRGIATEKEQLAKNGLEKNYKPLPPQEVDGKPVTSKPDALKNGGKSTFEIKDVKGQSLTRQLKAQQKFSNENGFKPELLINRGAKLSGPLKESSFDIKFYQATPSLITPSDNTKVIIPVQPIAKPCINCI